jgi:PAS domain S-box-containing protein
MIGLEREEVVGRPCYEFVCPNHRENCPLRDQDAPHLENAERAMVNSEGVRIPILKSVAAFHYEGRECLIESFLDISELKNAQELLETQTAKLTALVDSMPEFIIYKDLAGAYMGCNMSFTTLTGLGLDDVAGRFDHDLFPEELMEFFVHKDEEVLNRGKSASYERTLELPDAGRRRVEMTKLPYYRDDGQQIGLIGVARDVTDRHNLEVLKEDVDHIMRHDLRSPLNGIKGIVGVMLAEADMKPDEAREWLKLLDDEAGRMNRLIDTSLSLMKMEQGSYVYEPRPVDVIEILSKLERELDGLLKSREVGLSVRVNGDSANGRRFDIMGDEVLSHSMLSNLVRNAVEASPRGRTVSVDAWLEDRARIMVRNEGAVPEEVRERFFEKFATAGKKNGTGLGTYSVKLIAESFGGRVAMSTSEASGTTITLELEPGEGLGAEPGASRLSAAG